MQNRRIKEAVVSFLLSAMRVAERLLILLARWTYGEDGPCSNTFSLIIGDIEESIDRSREDPRKWFMSTFGEALYALWIAIPSLVLTEVGIMLRQRRGDDFPTGIVKLVSLLFPAHEREVWVGDLREDFEDHCSLNGVQSAQQRLKRLVLKSVWKSICAATAKLLYQRRISR